MTKAKGTHSRRRSGHRDDVAGSPDVGGYRTLTATDGQRGIELIEQESPTSSCLISTCPALKGMDVLKRMAQNKQCEDIPVIVMTAAGTIPDAVEAMRHGAYDFLTKPLKKDHLLIVIQKALEDSAQTAGGCAQVGRRTAIPPSSETVQRSGHH